MVLYLFFAVLMCASFFTDVDAALVSIVSAAMAVLAWLVIFEGVWIILASIYQIFYSKVLAVAPVLLTIVRGLVVLITATVLDALELVITQGVTI